MLRVVLPILVMWLIFKRGLTDYGFSPKVPLNYGGSTHFSGIVMVVVIFYASTLPAF